MERTDVSGKEAGGGIGSGGEGFIDRSKVRILLCDNDAKSSDEVFTLLCKCSYQVTSVRSPRQVIDALNAEGPDIDIILSEVDLPMSKGFKFLKYIMKDEELRRIPVIMMSAQDEVSIVVKCLKFGAADYLVKPLRTNELLNLWTHMWRRRRMLGLDEKNILNYDFDLVAFDPSDANTNSTTLFSNDTDEKSRKSANSDLSVSPHEPHEDEANAATGDAPVEIQLVDSMEDWPDVPGISDRLTAQMSSCPKKSELKIGESSAFFTYVKSSFLKSNVEDNAPQPLRGENKSNIGGQMIIDTLRHSRREALDYHSQGDDIPGSKSIPPHSMERSCTPPMTLESSLHGTPKVDDAEVHMHLREESHHGVSGFHPHTAYPYYISGMMNQVMMSSAGPMYQNNLQNHKTTTMVPHYDCMPRCSSHVPGMASFPYYPVSICMQPGQMPAPHTWPSYGNSSSMEGNLNKVDRREAALLKFRQKRKERCFDKKVRYVNRKHLAERRPRVRGQFVRKINGVNVDLNGQPASADYDDDDEDDEDQANRDSSPEDDASFQ